VTFPLDSPSLGGSTGHSWSTWRLLVERSLDEFSKSLARHLSISLSTAMPVAMDDQHPLTRKAGTQTGHQTGLGGRADAVRITQTPA
jgi:hypothetical protein